MAEILQDLLLMAVAITMFLFVVRLLNERLDND